MKLIPIISGFILWSVIAFAGNDNNCNRSTEGTDFWFGFMENRVYRENLHTIQITVSAHETTNFNITIGSPDAPIYNQSFSVSADSTQTIEIPWRTAEAIGSEYKQNTGIHLTSDKNVSVLAINWDPNSTDITAIFPVETLGKEYFAMCYEPHIDPNNPLSGNGRNSEFLIVGTENQTVVKITPSKVTDKLVPKDSTFEIILNKGEVYQVQSENEEGSQINGQGDLTGSRVVADKPVAFFSGALSTTVPNWQCCWDHLYEQIPPVQSWGREYYTVPFKTRVADRFRILAAKDNTTVQISGEPLIYLNEGEFREFEFPASDAKQVVSDKPLLVAQFSQSNHVDSTETDGNGDPFMIILNPADRGVNTAIFDTYGAPKTVADSTYIGIKRNFVNIISPTVDVRNIRLDGQPVTSEFQPYSEGTWSFAQIEIPNGSHIIENNIGANGFIAYVYGFGGYESYGFGAGYNLDLTLDLGENIEFFKKDTLLLCHGDTLLLDAGPQFNSYKWSTGETTQAISVTTGGQYRVEAESENCLLKDTVFVYTSTPKADLGDRYDEGCHPYSVLLSGDAGYEKYIWQNEFNDTISTLQSIIASSTGEYRLTVTDHFRCVARDTFGLNVFPVPKIEIGDENLICGNKSAQLSVAITGTADSIWNLPGNYSWLANNNKVVLSEENRFSAKIEVSDWGNFEIYYKLKTIDNCETTDTFKIRFHPQPVSDFTFEDDALCEGYSKKLIFTGSATDSAFFDWNLDGCQFVDTLDLQKHIYNVSVGTFQQKQPQISLIINDNGCISNTAEKLLSAKPNFIMEADKTRGCDSLTVNFSSRLLTPDNVEFVWTFDDTEIVRQQNFTKYYPDTGFYKVNLTITNPVTQCQNGFTIDSMIKVFPTPIAEISADPTLCYPGTALLVYTHHIDSSFCIWEIGGNVWSGFEYDSIMMNIYHPVELVKLRVEEFGCKSKPFEMNLKRKPNFDFSVDSEEGCQPFAVDAFAKTADPQIEFDWVTDSIPFPGTVHQYYFPDTGRYDIGLIATSIETGCADTLLKPDLIWVHRNPYSKFEVDFQVALIENSTITFTNYSERADNYFWDFGDSITSEEFEPVHTYKQLGEYTARLYAESVFGCADTFELGVKIIPSTVYSPNAFRPDSDIPENQTFMPVGAGVDESRFNLKIFNRWGELIFESISLFNPWDGTLKNGKDAPMGNYVWISNYFDIQGFEHNEKGQVLLVR